MATISKLVLEFRLVDDPPKEEGLKLACFQIWGNGKMIGHDWGFANYENGQFEKLEDSGMIGTVVKWCELPNTKLLF